MYKGNTGTKAATQQQSVKVEDSKVWGRQG